MAAYGLDDQTAYMLAQQYPDLAQYIMPQLMASAGVTAAPGAGTSTPGMAEGGPVNPMAPTPESIAAGTPTPPAVPQGPGWAEGQDPLSRAIPFTDIPDLLRKATADPNAPPAPAPPGPANPSSLGPGAPAAAGMGAAIDPILSHAQALLAGRAQPGASTGPGAGPGTGGGGEEGMISKALRGEEQATKEGRHQLAGYQAALLNQQEKTSDYQRETQAEFQGATEAHQKALQDEWGKVQKNLDDVKSSTIDPNHWWHNLSTPGKVLAGLAAVVGGIGQGLTRNRTPNMGVEGIDEAISRDLYAQKEAFENKRTTLAASQTLYAHLYGQFHDSEQTLLAGRAIGLQAITEEGQGLMQRMAVGEQRTNLAKALADTQLRTGEVMATMALRREAIAAKGAAGEKLSNVGQQKLAQVEAGMNGLKRIASSYGFVLDHDEFGRTQFREPTSEEQASGAFPSPATSVAGAVAGRIDPYSQARAAQNIVEAEAPAIAIGMTPTARMSPQLLQHVRTLLPFPGDARTTILQKLNGAWHQHGDVERQVRQLKAGVVPQGVETPAEEEE